MKRKTSIVLGAALVAAGTVGWTYYHYRRQMKDRIARLRAGSHLLQTPNGVIEYATTGAGPAILISHGALEGYDHGIAMGRFMPDFHIISPSRFGYLRSSVPEDATPAAQADAYAALLDALEIPQAAIVAISGGGASALEFALRHPDRCRALVMISAVSQPPPEKQGPGVVFVTNLVLNNADFLFWLIETISQDMILRAVGLPPGTTARLTTENPHLLTALREVLRFTPISLRRAGIVNDADWSDKFTRLPIERITAPTLAIHGTDDPIMPFAHGEWVAQTVPNATLLPIEGGGHLCLFTHHTTTIPALSAFLRQHAT
jgi:pimeloyl-ACP methyl ester carboxylesterase